MSDPRTWRTWEEILAEDLVLCYDAPCSKEETLMTNHTPDPIIDVQDTLDAWLAGHPDAQQYVTRIYYVPDGAEIPRDVTHMNRLTSVDHPDLELRLGVVATRETTTMANVILSLIERSAADPKREG
jgi:hypothetical protein